MNYAISITISKKCMMLSDDVIQISKPAYGYLCDIGLNLLDDMFRGVYNSKKLHPEDYAIILNRAHEVGVKSCFITCGCVDECKSAISVLNVLESKLDLYMTVGIHPTRCSDFSNEELSLSMLDELTNILDDANLISKVIAIGECGLDYDRLHFCDKESQKIGFEKQFELAEKYSLPIFFHDRNTNGDFLEMVTRNLHKVPRGGVVHSFTGTISEMLSYTSLGLYIGINGCSLKSEENLEVIRHIPLHFLLLETDAPWCAIKNTHASMKYVKTQFPMKKKEKYENGYLVKDRCEPCHIVQVLEVVAAIHNIDCNELARIVWENTCRLFFPNKSVDEV